MEDCLLRWHCLCCCANCNTEFRADRKHCLMRCLTLLGWICFRRHHHLLIKTPQDLPRLRAAPRKDYDLEHENERFSRREQVHNFYSPVSPPLWVAWSKFDSCESFSWCVCIVKINEKCYSIAQINSLPVEQAQCD